MSMKSEDDYSKHLDENDEAFMDWEVAEKDEFKIYKRLKPLFDDVNFPGVITQF